MMKTEIDNIAFRSLDGVPFEDIADAFLSAFSDYGMDLDATKLRDMFIRRGARCDLSFAAFAGDKIVSFIINGIGSFNGRPTAYDTGTGTVKEYRGLGLTDRIFAYSTDFMKAAGIEGYLLEVLTHNVPAVKIYRRQGFEMTRKFDCYSSENDTVKGTLNAIRCKVVEIREVDALSIERVSSFMDINPSWQNSLDSIKRNPHAFTCLMAFDGDVAVGFGVSETAYGDITLLAIDKVYRRRGIGSAILYELVERSCIDKVKVLNVENANNDIRSFLTRVGFELSCQQYEMVKVL